MKVAVVGATGLVGREMLTVLQETKFPVSELIPVASEKSVGTTVEFGGKPWKVVSMKQAVDQKPDIALFSAGGSTSLAHAPEFAETGCVVIDNSSAWRMDPNVPLVVPEVNAGEIGNSKLIANPNCSTIQMVVVLAPLNARYGIKRLVISTYQSVTGTGKNAVEQLMSERRGVAPVMVYPHTIDLNCIPQCDVFLPNDYTKEEMKLVNETHKILQSPEIGITATTVRVPVIGGHSEAINVEFHQEFDLEELKSILTKSPGVIVMDDPSRNHYPTPKFAQGKNEVFVGRIRRDESQPKSLNLWIVADNLRKGAATNAVQIAFEVLRNRSLS